MAEVAATSVTGFLQEVDGRTVQTASGPVTLETRIATTEAEAGEGTVALRFDNLGPLQRLTHAIATPSMVYLLLVLGLASLAFEITQPGFGFAGFAGVGMLALAAYGLWVVPPSILGIVLLLGGVGALTLDVRMRNLGVATAAGLVAFAAGSVLAWSDVAGAIRISPWLIGGAVVVSLLYYGFALTVAIQSRDRIVDTQQGLIGLTGEARGRLAPDGPVYVKGAMWRGRTSGDPIAPGSQVRVRGVDGLVLAWKWKPGHFGDGADPRDPRHIRPLRGVEQSATGPVTEQSGEMWNLAEGWQHEAACRGQDAVYFFAPELLRAPGAEERPGSGGQVVLRALPRARGVPRPPGRSIGGRHWNSKISSGRKSRLLLMRWTLSRFMRPDRTGCEARPRSGPVTIWCAAAGSEPDLEEIADRREWSESRCPQARSTATRRSKSSLVPAKRS